MKKIVLFFAIAAMLGCGQKGKDGGAAAGDSTVVAQEAVDTADVEAATKQLKAIYADVFGWYARAEKDVTLMDAMPDFDARYLSSSYLALKKQVEKKDSGDAEEGMIGFFDSDHWVCGQDFSDLSFSVKSVKATGKNQCLAEVEIKNCGAVVNLTLVLVEEKGEWKIDDFVTDGSSEKESMKEYVDEGMN